MKNRIGPMLAISALLLATLPTPSALNNLFGNGAAHAADVSVSVFFEPLGKHGRWLSTSANGYVWVPARVNRDWRPYSHGHWEYSRRHGWVWISEEPWGWATYHYGRWGYDDGYGWYWVPGNRWGPAWVSWRRSDDHLGWAPLPPSGPGYAFSTNIANVSIGVGGWQFVRTRDFLAPNLAVHLVARDRLPAVYRRAQPAGTVRVINNVVVNTVVKVDAIERATKRRVVVRQIRNADRQSISVSGDSIVAYRPTISKQKPAEKPREVEDVKQLENRSAKLAPDAPAQGRRADGRRPDRDGKDRAKDRAKQSDDGDKAAATGDTSGRGDTQDTAKAKAASKAGQQRQKSDVKDTPRQRDAGEVRGKSAERTKSGRSDAKASSATNSKAKQDKARDTVREKTKAKAEGRSDAGRAPPKKDESARKPRQSESGAAERARRKQSKAGSAPSRASDRAAKSSRPPRNATAKSDGGKQRRTGAPAQRRSEPAAKRQVRQARPASDAQPRAAPPSRQQAPRSRQARPADDGGKKQGKAAN